MDMDGRGKKVNPKINTKTAFTLRISVKEGKKRERGGGEWQENK